MAKRASHSLRNWLAVALASTLVACATVDSTPEAPSVAGNDRQVAAKQHPQIVAEFGGEVEGPISTYVKATGAKIAQSAGLADQCTFTVINSDVVNAFAVPGCYIYITRGLLAIMNSEDELASVLGHEVGHVTADHSAQRQNRQTLTTLGALAVGILTGSGQWAQLAGQVGQIYTLSFSREQEFQSDDLGIRYMRNAGYDAFAAADMLNALGANDALTTKTANRSAASEIPAWARTHPLSADRVTRANAQAQAAGAQRGVPPEKTGPYLNAIRGMIFGDDPEQGFVNGRTFAHPGLRIAFEAPEGFTLTNTTQAVIIAGASGKAQFAGGALPPEGLAAYAGNGLRQLVGQTPAQYGPVQRSTTNGLETAQAPARVQNQNGQILSVALTAYKVGDRAYHFVTIAPDGGGAAMAPMLSSFRVLTEAQAAALKPRRIDLVTVGPRDTVQSLAARMAFDDFRVERFLTLNGRDANTPLRPGEIVKLVSYGR